MVLRLALPLAAAAFLLLFAVPAGAVKNRPPHWVDLATSSTGTIVLGAAYEDGVYLSKDSGRTFTRAPIPSDCKLCGPSGPTRDDGCQYAAVAISSNGNLLFAAAVHDGIYRSTDGGRSWSKSNAPTLMWQQSMACSASGQYVYALTPTCPGSGRDKRGNACSSYGIWRSTNNGAQWSRSGAQALNWKAVASSENGQRVVAVAAGNGIYTSGDYGRNWRKTPAPATHYVSVAVSGDAMRVVAIAFGDQNVHIGANVFGSSPTWTRKPVYTSTSAAWKPWMVVNASIQSWHNWRAVASSTVGDRLAFVSNYGFVYTSKNSGANINPNAGATPAKGGVARTAGWEWWVALAGSSDGKVLYAADVLSGSLYTSANYGGGAWTRLNIPNVAC